MLMRSVLKFSIGKKSNHLQADENSFKLLDRSVFYLAGLVKLSFNLYGKAFAPIANQ